MRKTMMILLALVAAVFLSACTADDTVTTGPQAESGTTVSAAPFAPYLSLKLKDEAELTLEYGEKYIEPGVIGLYYGPDNRIDVLSESVSGQVDTAVLGTYILAYTIEYEGMTASVERKVHVVDTQPPEITLVTKPDYSVYPGETYIEEGFTAMDGYDGDLTAQVQRREKTGKIIYTVSDSSGNQTCVERQIPYGDRTAPVLTLLGKEEMYVYAGTRYRELGYTASDDLDGDVTQNVTITGRLDTGKAGTYTLTYTVADSHGNQSIAKRTIHVLKQDTSKPEDKVIYLTFDDGPSSHTLRLLEILERYNVKATFFVMKTGAEENAKQIFAAGHSVGIHTTTHRYEQVYANKEAYYKDLYGMQSIVYEMLGLQTNLMRFPGGSSNKVSKDYCEGIMTELVGEVTEKGFLYYDWNVSSKDAAGATTSDEVFANVIEGIGDKQKVVVLQHDCYGFSVDAVERIILWGLQNGYGFQALDLQSPECKHNFMNN